MTSPCVTAALRLRRSCDLASVVDWVLKGKYQTITTNVNRFDCQLAPTLKGRVAQASVHRIQQLPVGGACYERIQWVNTYTHTLAETPIEPKLFSCHFKFDCERVGYMRS